MQTPYRYFPIEPHWIAPGMQFLSARFFEPARQVCLDERVERETAFQWWGLSVGLRSFDDAWRGS